MVSTKTKIRLPTSRFLEVECRKCGEKAVVFNKCATVAVCGKCGDTLANPTGGFANITGKVVKELE
ncbi:MAG: 30S ribosomal protein S27e [Candidatus Aenigmatarchaeota archaeon]